jgi:hypothetical protein
MALQVGELALPGWNLETAPMMTSETEANKIKHAM